MAVSHPTPPRSVRSTLETSATAAGVSQAVIAVVIGLLAASRSANHTLSALAVTGLVAAWAAVLATIGWPQGMYAGAADVIAGRVAFDAPLSDSQWSPAHAAKAAERRYGSRFADGFAPRAIWRGSIAAAVLAAAWAATGAGLMAAVLNGRQARWFVVVAAVAGLAGTSAVVVDTLGRRHGMAAARRLLDAPVVPVGLRYRAWRQVALPLAAVQATVNGAGSWILFHSYHRASGAAFGPALQTGPVLTSKVAVADAIVTVVILGTLITVMTRTWGGVDAALGRVTLDAPDAQRVTPSRPFGPQVVVYVGVLTLLLAKVGQMVLPKAPNLVQVGLVRAALAGVVAFLTAGFGYVRGAANAAAGPA